MAGASPFLPTGYGKVVRYLAPYLASRGYEVYLLASGYRGEQLVWNGVVILSTYEGAIYSSVGQDTLRTDEALRTYKPDVFLIIGDILLLEPIFKRKEVEKPPWKLVCYFPIDSDPWRPREVRYAKVIDVPVIPSRWGVEVLRKQGGIEAVYIPHGVETNIYRPYPPLERKNKRIEEGLDDKFVVLYVGTNNSRKGIPTLLEAFDLVRKEAPDAVLCMVTTPRDPSGYDLNSLLQRFKLEKSVLIPPFSQAFSLSTRELIDMYNIADVYTSATQGEGFSLTHIEALSCGCPVVSPRHSALTEMLEGVGILTELSGVGYIDNFGSWKPIPSAQSLAEGILRVYRMEDWERAKMSRNSRIRALDYDWAKVLREWDRVFDELI